MYASNISRFSFLLCFYQLLSLSHICRSSNTFFNGIFVEEIHLEDPKLKIKESEPDGFAAYHSCSTAKKGYSGSAVYVKQYGKNKKNTIGNYFAKKSTGKNDKEDKTSSELPFDEKLLIPENVEYKMGKGQVEDEGRFISIDFPLFSMAACYVPNSGQKLERLDMRTKEWDQHLLEFMQEKQTKRGVPVMWLGDLNVAHGALECWNDGAKHLGMQ